MLETARALDLDSQIQREAACLLLLTRRGFMRADLFRERLIKRLALGGTPATLQRINKEVEALVEQRLLVRQVSRGEHEIGIHKMVWKVAPETICAIREATRSVVSGNLFVQQSREIEENVKRQLRRMQVSRRQVSDAVLQILVSRFSANQIQ